MSAQYRRLHKEARENGAAATNPTAGREQSLWQWEGTPCHGAVPTTWANPDNTTPGGWQQDNPAAGKQQWLTTLAMHAGTYGRYVLYDRLGHMGGLSGTVTTAQNVNGGSLGAITRYYDVGNQGLGNEIFLEVYTQIGATPTTVTAAYTNQSGNSATTQAVAIGGTGLREVDRIIRLPLADGDTGVQGVTSVTVLATTGTAGNFGLIVAQRILIIEIGSNNLGEHWAGAGSGGFKEIISGACLAWAFVTAGNTSNPFGAFYSIEDN